MSEYNDKRITEAALTKPAGFSKEDWLIIDETLNRVARSLRKIEKEQRRKELERTADQPPEIR